MVCVCVDGMLRAAEFEPVFSCVCAPADPHAGTAALGKSMLTGYDYSSVHPGFSVVGVGADVP